MSLETGYWIALSVGVGFLLISVVLGDVLDIFDFLNIEVGDGLAITPIFFTAVAAFGAGGLLGLNAFDLSRGGSIISGLTSSVLIGGLTTAFFALLHKQEAGEPYSVAQLVGSRGRCTLAIAAGGEGRVSVNHESMTRTLTATSDESVTVGQEVVVLDVVGNVLKVQPAVSATPGESG